MAREAGAVRVIVVSCSPAIRYPHIVSLATMCPYAHPRIRLCVVLSGDALNRILLPLDWFEEKFERISPRVP